MEVCWAVNPLAGQETDRKKKKKRTDSDVTSSKLQIFALMFKPHISTMRLLVLPYLRRMTAAVCCS